jgi:hypothetical protein
MIIVLLILQILANIMLGITLRYLCQTYKIPITVHNFPIIIFWCMGLLGIMWLSITHITLFLIGGVVVALLMLTGYSVDFSSETSSIKKIFSCLVGLITWAQLLTIVWFFAVHQEQLKNENPEHR